jgi:hypothetical protein
MWDVRGAVYAAIVSLTVIAGGSCVHRQSGTLASAVNDSPPAEPVVLEVENHNWSDINIYIIHDGRRNRLTSVTAAKDTALAIPPQYQGETGVFSLVVYRVGGRDIYRSPAISIRTGKTVRLTIESSLARSSIGVW